MITKISRSEIRTIHVTGLVTDIGIELGTGIYWNRGTARTDVHYVRADRRKLALLGSLRRAFLLGGLADAVGFERFGFAATVPLAAALLLFARVPLGDDLRTFGRRERR